MIVDLALSVTGSQLIGSVLPAVCHALLVISRRVLTVDAGRQGSTCPTLRVHPRPHRHASRMQDWIEGHLALVCLIPFFRPRYILTFVLSDRMVSSARYS